MTDRKEKKAKTPKQKLTKRRLRVRRLRQSDYEPIRQLQIRCFPGMEPWLPEQFANQVSIFPEGQLCIEYEGRIIASSSSLIVDFDLYSDWHDWHVIADDGYIRNHSATGDTLYGIEIMVDPDYRGYRLSRRLYDARKKLVREKNLARIIIGGRIPGYGKRADQMTPEEYIDKVMCKELRDPVLTAQLANGFQLQGLIPGYLPSDRDSAGYATFLEWTNLDYRADGKRQIFAVQRVRIGVVQFQERRVNSFEEFAQQCEFFVDSAADSRADFVLFPELFTTPLLSLAEPVRPGLAARQLAEFSDLYVEMFTGLALRYNINIVGGSHFTIEDGNLYNMGYLFRRDGSVGRQPKIHITPNERRWWGVSPGKRISVFDTDRGKIALFICYDIEFPELSRLAVNRGAQIIFVPFNTHERYGYLRVRYCAQARCIENHIYVVTAGCTGNLPNVENADIHYAQSAIFTPSDIPFSRDGIAAECTPNIETVLVHDVDIELLRRHRYNGTTQNWLDRRKDLYRVRFQNGDESCEV